MITENYDIDFYTLQLAQSIESAQTQKWIAEISSVIGDQDGASIVPAKIGRSEPYLRRSGAIVMDEPLDDDMRTGAFKRIISVTEKNDVRAIFVHDYHVLELAINIKRKHRAPLILIAQNPVANIGYFAKRKMIKNFLLVDHFIAASQYLADYLMSEFQIPQDRISVIYEGFDLQLISSAQVSQERTMSLAHAWGAVEDMSELVLIPAIYQDPVWCQNLLAFAREIAGNSKASIRYVVIGDDDGTGVMQKLNSSIMRICPSRIQLAGHCADIEAAIKLTNTVLNLYSTTETQFSQSLIAQALGRFVFLPLECPSAHEFLDNKITGKLLLSDPAEVRESVESFVANAANLREGNFVDSRSFILKHFSRDVMHSKLRTLFEDARFADYYEA